MESLRRVWSRSLWFRAALVAAIVYVALRFVLQVVYLSGYGQPGEATTLSGQFVPNDLKDYLLAADRLEKRQDLYLEGKLDRVEFYQYAPSYALAFTAFLRLPPLLTVIIHTLLHVAAYVTLYVWWRRIFRWLGLDRANDMLVSTLPVWMVFETFWSDLGFLNIYIVVALVATLLIDTILREHLAGSLLWLSILLQVKPHWAFAAGVPFLMGSRRFFFRLASGAVLIYMAVVAITLAAVGPFYGWRQQLAYYQFLWNLPGNFPWRGPEDGFLGYNHSITQIMVFLFGATPTVLHVATAIKIALLLPLGVVALRYVLRFPDRLTNVTPQLKLEAAFVLYLGAFIWLDMVWELSLGIVLFAYLLAVLDKRVERAAVWIVFMPYALLDVWRVVSYVALGDSVLAGAYILTDPSIYVPLIMIVILTFYVFLIRRLWIASEV